MCCVWGRRRREQQHQNWFTKFCSGDFPLKNQQRSGRSVEADDDKIKTIIDSDRHSTYREIAFKTWLYVYIYTIDIIKRQ